MFCLVGVSATRQRNYPLRSLRLCGESLFRCGPIAGHQVIFSNLGHFGKSLLANRHRVRAAGVEPAAARRHHQIGHMAVNAFQAIFHRKFGDRIQQCPAIWVQRSLEKVFDIGHFTQIAGIHDTDPITGFGHHTQVMGDQ